MSTVICERSNPVSIEVIPGRVEDANPESRDTLARNCAPEFKAIRPRFART
jgi:hypothetical protein